MSAENSPIPRFILPETYTRDRDRNYRAFRSPEDGKIVQILDGLWHAARIEDWMRADGERLALDDFQQSAQDAYPEYGYDMRQNMAGAAFNAVLKPMMDEAVTDAWKNPAYEANPYRPYASWIKDQWRRRQFLVSTQAAYDTYQGLVHHEKPAKRQLKFLRTFDVLFDVAPQDEPEITSQEEDE